MPAFVNDGLSIHYEVHGSGSPVVMLHGAAVTFAGNFGYCGWIEPMAGRGLQALGMDLRGHGRSATPPDASASGSDAIAKDVIELLDDLAIERASIIGYSIGSQVALHTLHSHPSRFTAAALVATGDGLIGGSPLTFPAMLPNLAEILRRPAFPEDLPPHQAAYWTFAEQMAGDREAVAIAMGGDFSPCTPAEVATIDVPVLVVSGDQDVVLGTGARLAEALPKGRYHEIAGADHFSLATDDAVQREVADFLAEIA
jgi:pimeloyl-ACP methyl ester carboxylesterase